MKRYLHPILTAALFTVVRNRKKPESPLIGKNMWCVHIRGHYSVLKTKEILPSTRTMKRKGIMLSEIIPS